jgi:hypothetical protein
MTGDRNDRDDRQDSHDGAPTLVPGEPRSFGGGRYIVRKRLGAGNFATVYLAYDERLDVPVAVKLLSDRWSWEPEVRGRFVQEARLLRSLNDARVVQIRDIAETDDGRPYLVMDLATRGTLEQRLVELAQRGVRPDAKQLRTIAAAMADSLGFLHERRIAHRDIKPSNLLITTAGAATAAPETGPPMLLRPGERLMLGDLGLAKDLTFDSGITVGVGTAGYMAPEQSLAGAKIDTRTDIYAASALLAQIASGEPPDPLRRYSNGTIQSGRPLPPTIPAQLGRALGHGLDTDPALRPQTIEQWHAEVDQALLTLVDAEPAAQPSHPRRRLAGVAAGAIAVLGVAGVAVATLGGTAAPTAATTTTVATTTTPTTAAPTTAAPTTVAVTAATALPTAIITGPTEIPVGVQSWWSVTSSNATSGTWSLTGPVQLGDASWLPGDSFQGTWNDPGVITLTLTVFDEAGHSSQATFVFTVV